MDREIKELVCIVCPLGCNLKAVSSGGRIEEITGNTCPRGAEYAQKELTDPRRVLTTTVRVRGGSLPAVSVKTLTDIPKERIFQCMRELKDVVLEAPVDTGQVAVENIADTGIPVVTTKAVRKEVNAASYLNMPCVEEPNSGLLR